MPQASSAQRRPYAPPAIRDYGDLIELTANVGGDIQRCPAGQPDRRRAAAAAPLLLLSVQGDSRAAAYAARCLQLLRPAGVATAVARDGARLAGGGLVPRRRGVRARRARRAIAWLCRTPRRHRPAGSSKGFSLLHGWLPAYPETTGYVIGTLLAYAERRGRPGRPGPARAGDGRLGARGPGPTGESWRAPSAPSRGAPSSSTPGWSFTAGSTCWSPASTVRRRGRAGGEVPDRPPAPRRDVGPQVEYSAIAAHLQLARRLGDAALVAATGAEDVRGRRGASSTGSCRAAPERLVRRLRLPPGDAAEHARVGLHAPRGCSRASSRRRSPGCGRPTHVARS